MMVTPYAQKFRGAAISHARSRYAGGSWRSARPVGLSVSIRRWRFDGQLCAGSKRNRASGRSGKDANHNGHVPATGAARLLDVLIQSAIIVVDGVAVSRAVGMNVGDLVRGGLLMRMTASKTVVIAARLFGCSA